MTVLGQERKVIDQLSYLIDSVSSWFLITKRDPKRESLGSTPAGPNKNASTCLHTQSWYPTRSVPLRLSISYLFLTIRQVLRLTLFLGWDNRFTGELCDVNCLYSIKRVICEVRKKKKGTLCDAY